MVKDNTTTQKDLSTGDRAVSGLLGGLLAGVPMAAVLMLAGLLDGDTLELAASRFNLFNNSGTPQQFLLQGLLLHLGTAAVYGVIYGLLRGLLPQRLPGWLSGLFYGLLLFALAELAILPGTGSPLAAFPAIFLLAGHAVYGLVLGLRD